MHQLSGGQRQRVALARALVLEPAILFLDEPLTGLDEQLRQQLGDEIGRLHRRLGSTFLAVTHNQEEALSLSDRVALLRMGRIEQVGSPRELFEWPANAFVARFVGVDAMIRPDSVEPGREAGRARVAGGGLPACRPCGGSRERDTSSRFDQNGSASADRRRAGSRPLSLSPPLPTKDGTSRLRRDCPTGRC